MSTMNTSKWESKFCDNKYVLVRRMQELHDSSSRNQLECAFLNLIRTNLEITQELIDILDDVRNTQLTKRVVSTTGTSIGALGAISMVAGVFLAPATGGASMLLGMGAVASITSGVAAIGTCFYNRRSTQAFVQHIEQLQKRQNRISEELDCKLGIINALVVELTRQGVEEKVAVRAAISVMRDRIEDMITGPNGEISPVKILKLAQRIMADINSVSGLAAAAGVTLGRDAKVVKDAVKLFTDFTTKIGETGANGVAKGRQMATALGEGIAASTTKTMIKRVGAVTGVIFTAIDIAFLVKEWKTPDPLIAHIEDVVSVLMFDVDKCQNMVDIIRGLSCASQLCIH